MALKSKLLLVNELQPGMISANDINFEDKVLLAKGAAISEAAIEKLRQNYIIDRVEVYIDDGSDEVLTIKPKTAEEIENSFNEFSSNLQEIFEKLSTINASGMNEIRTFSKKIQDELNSTGLVIRNIVFHGSGTDVIYRHSVNVAAISFILGKWIGFEEREINLLTYSSILHDFGKVKIDKKIIYKKEKLTSEEYELFKTHPVIGYNFIKKIPYLDVAVKCGVLMHHERIDGSGYPLGIKEDKIHKFAKVIAIADLFDRVSSNRYSRKVKGPLEALEVIKEESLGRLDCKYCDIFLKHIINYYMGENVLLNNKHICKIIKIDANDLTRPLLLDENGFVDLNKEKDLYVEKLVLQ